MNDVGRNEIARRVAWLCRRFDRLCTWEAEPLNWAVLAGSRLLLAGCGTRSATG
jgi:hypothetical protein